ncbi:MAG: hypothetical protein HC930_03085 [Hydrococcus sp. SU_1_0]|nr:hypothetical protein [Hydrococcus sp. SU_1_0]
MWFHDEPITHLEGRPYFSLIKVSPEIQQATQASFKQLQKLPNHVNLKYENHPSEFEIADRVLGLLLVNSKENFWNFWYEGSNILYKVYAEPELLEKIRYDYYSFK